MKILIVTKEASLFESDALYIFMRSLIKKGDEIVLRSLAEEREIPAAFHDINEFDRAVIAGNDKTVTAALFVLRNQTVPLLIFPEGMESLYFDSLGNAAEPAALAKACREGHVINADLGQISWKDPNETVRTLPFSCMAGFGFDATLLKAAIPNKEAIGTFAYFLAAFNAPKPTVATFEITLDNSTFTTQGISCLIANSSNIGGDIHIVSGSILNDSILDVIVLQSVDGKGLLRPYLRGLLDHKGDNLGRPEIEHFQGMEVSVRSSVALPLQINGEPTPYDVKGYSARILPGANRLIVDNVSPFSDEAE